MDETDRQMDRALDALRRTRGACPAPEVLAGYLEGALTESEREAVEGHVAACGRCEYLLWRAEERDGPVVDDEGGRRWWRWLWHPAIGYGVAGLALGTLFLWRPQPAAPVARPVWGAAQVLNLNVPRGEAAPPSASATEAAGYVVLQFRAPVAEGEAGHVEVLGAGGTRVAAMEGVRAGGEGRFAVVCPAAALPAGEYRVVLTVGTGQRMEFRFAVK